MKKTKVFYWVFTGLFSFMMLGSAIPDIVSAQLAVDGFKQIGLPAYLLPFLGIAKTLGVIAILVPGYQTIKEWAYAGLLFDLSGAMYSVAAGGQPVAAWLPILLPIALGVVSYTLYRKRLNAKHVNDAQLWENHRVEYAS
jgi:hypothetical protein